MAAAGIPVSVLPESALSFSCLLLSSGFLCLSSECMSHVGTSSWWKLRDIFSVLAARKAGELVG